MEFIVRVEARLAGRVVKVCDVVTIARPGVVRGEEELGLSLEDGKEIVRELQSRMVAGQVEMLEAPFTPNIVPRPPARYAFGQRMLTCSAHHLRW
jgi:hypothetical protein